jgi:hypothetical protein
MRAPAAAIMGALAAALTITSAATSVGAEPGNARQGTQVDEAWPMHPIDGRWRGANALGRGDIDHDGLTDYAVNYEFDQRYVAYLHPPAGTDATSPWRAVDLVPNSLRPGQGIASESAALADLDGDGNVDLIGAQSGDPQAQLIGYEPGIRVFWGPPAAQALDASAWIDAGRITQTIDAGHYHWVTPHDVDDDGDTDLLVGGRVLFSKHERTGVLWIEAPDDPSVRRDLSQWHVHDIDGNELSGHEALPTDVDEDGDDDIVVANADFDTPDNKEEVVWYENPGTGSAAQRGPWKKRRIYRSPDFTIKPQLGIGDLDDDGHTDLVTQTPDDLLVYRKIGVDPVRFEVIKVRKDDKARWTPRTVRVADVDDDGKLDVVGMLSHEQANVPIDKASVYWMEFDGKRPTRTNWTTHVVSWGPGRTMVIPTLGSKWDQADITDVDDDGDLDIVANNEEWWVEDDGELTTWDNPNRDPESVSVVWFENRLKTKPSVCKARSGTCVIEAEQPTRIGDGTWPERARLAGAVHNYAQVFNGLDLMRDCRNSKLRNQECPKAQDGALAYDATRGLRYDLDLPAGEYTIWLRALAPTRFGPYLGGPASDSAWIGLGGSHQVIGVGTGPGTWTWTKASHPVAVGDGITPLVLRARERGFAVDRIVVTSDTKLNPTGDGPPANRNETVAK